MFTHLPAVRNHEILAFAQTEIQSTGPCGIILAQRHDGELVTAWYRLGDSEWCHGHYFHPHLMKSDEAREKEIQTAYGDFLERVRSYKGPRKPETPEAVIKNLHRILDRALINEDTIAIRQEDDGEIVIRVDGDSAFAMTGEGKVSVMV